MVTVRTSHTVEEKKKEEISTAELKRVSAKASALVVKEEADKAAKIAAADAAAAAATAAQEAAAAAGMTHPLFPLTAASVLVIVFMFFCSPSCSTVAAAAASDHRTAPATPAAAPLPEPKPEPVIQDIKRQYFKCFHLCDFVARRYIPSYAQTALPPATVPVEPATGILPTVVSELVVSTKGPPSAYLAGSPLLKKQLP